MTIIEPLARAALLAAALACEPAWADPSVRIGARGGVELADAADPSAGVDLRLAFSKSPLTINPTFDYVFDANRTLYEVSINALYDLPVSLGRAAPYVGIGADVTSFTFKQVTQGVDNGGNRLGMNLVAGACFDFPIASPFIQIVKQIGELDPLSFGAGFVVALDSDPRWTGCGRRTR